MENFNELSKKISRYASNIYFLGVENFSKKNIVIKNTNNKAEKQSFYYSYKSIMKDNKNLSINELKRFLDFFEVKAKDKKISEGQLLIYKDLLSDLDTVKSNHYIKVNNDLEIYEIKTKIELLKERMTALSKAKNEYKEKRLNTLKSEISLQNKEIRRLKKEITAIENSNVEFSKKIESMKEVYIELDRSEELNKTQADLYVESLEKNMIVQFLTNKSINFTKWDFSKSQKIEEVFFFDDDTIVIKDKESYKSISPLENNYNKINQDISKDLISFTFRKKPNYIAKFNQLLEQDNYNISNAYGLANNFLENEQILKNKGFNLLDELTNAIQNKKSLEFLDDKLNKVVLDFKVNKLANSIISQKYRHLYNKDSEGYFRQIYDLNVSEEMLQNMIGRKLASFKTPKDLNRGLSLFINTINNFDPETIKKKANELNAEVCIESEKYIVLKIKDFNASKKLGSTSWCISREESYFESYTGKDASQYFYFDFTKDSKDILSMIGFTIRKNGEQYTAHKKNDTYIDFESKYKDVYVKTIENDIDNYELSKEKIKELGIDAKNTIIKQKLGM